MASEKIDALSLDISANLNTDNLDKVINKLGELDKALSKLKSKTLTVNINDARSAIDNTTPSVDKLTSSFLNQTVKIAAVIAVFKKLYTVISDGVANAAEYTKTLNMFTVSLGEYADNATKYGETVSDALGIDLAGWQNTQGIFDTLIKGMGVTSDKAAYMSQNLTQLAYDISSFYGITLTEAANKLKSAMAGRTQPARAIGYAPDQANAVDYAKNPKNYGKQTFAINQQTGAIEANTIATDENTQHKIVNFNQLTSAEKSIIRYNLLMSQNTQVQGNFARALNDPYNQLKIFKDQLNMTSRAFGNMFIPALNKVLPYLSAFAQLATQAFQSLARLFGFELPDMKDRATIDTKPYDDVVKATGKAKNNAKKMKDYMLGIDELNVFNPNTGAGAGGGGGVGGENSNLKNMKLRGYDFLGKAVENSIKQAKEAIQKFFGDLKKNPFILNDIFVWGASKLGENFWIGFLGKTPEELAADARKHGKTIFDEFASQAEEAFKNRLKDFQTNFWTIFIGATPDELAQQAYEKGTTIEYEMMRGFMSKTTGERIMNLLFGTPEEYAADALAAGNTVGEQFTLGLYKALLQFSKGNKLFKAIFELTYGKGSLDETIANIERKLAPKETAKREVSNPYPYVSYDKAKNISRIQGGTAMPTVSAKAKLMLQTNMTTDNAKKESQKYISAYTNTFAANNGTVQKSATDNLANPVLTGANDNGKAPAKLRTTANTQTNTFANSLGSPSAQKKAYNAMVSVANSGVTGADSKVKDFKEAGENSTKGYIGGILDLLKETGLAGAAIGKTALKALENTVKTGSPAKEFIKIGKWSALGFAKGMEDNTKTVAGFASNMGKSALNALTSASDMSDRIILNGTIADPSASVSARASNASGIGYGIGASNDYAMASLASQIYQAVVSGMTAASANNEDKDIKVIIDGKEVFKAVQTESRKRGIAVSNGTFSR